MSERPEAAIRFATEVECIDATTIVRVPKTASELLPSRGQVAVHAAVNGHEFPTVLEPDGRKGHWMRIGQRLYDVAGMRVGDAVDVAVAPVADWPEPVVPSDLAAALAAAARRTQDVWQDITPMARWEWVRWVEATANPATRQRRVEVSVAKMDSGKRRPCCFDLSACTDPAVSRNGKLRDR